MASKNGLRIYLEKKTGKFKYRIVMDYFHPYEEKWKQVTSGSNSTTKTALEAIKNKLSLKVDKILGQYQKKTVNLTVSQALDAWLKEREATVAKGTFLTDKTSTKAFQEKFGRWQVAKMEKDHIKTFFLDLNLAPSSRNNIRAKLNLLFDFCEDEGYLTANPMYGLKLPQVKETLPHKEKREDKFFTVTEVQVLLEAMEKEAQKKKSSINARNAWRKRYLIEFQFSLGSRISETLGIRYQDIDFEQGHLHLKRQLDRYAPKAMGPQLTVLKNKHSERLIILKQRELEILNWFKAENQTKSAFVFVQASGHLFQSSTINNYLKSFHEVLPYKQKSSFVTHALRHGNVMFKKELGIDEQIIVRDGGWSDTQMISRVYGRHITANMEAKAALALRDFSVKNSRQIHKKCDEQ